MSANKTGDLSKITVDEHCESSGRAKLTLDIRLIIWACALVYSSTPGRIVEVRIMEYDHHNFLHHWCPRYLPSSTPSIFNLCQEARHEAHRLARVAGHILFPTASNSPNIYFNPTIDTLYIHNENNSWVRDWGSESVLTPVKQESKLEYIRSLAISLDQHTTAITVYHILSDMTTFEGIEEVIFVVE